MGTRKHLTRVIYNTTAFQGWRICVGANVKSFIKYFSDKKYGSDEAARLAAERFLDRIKVLIQQAKEKDGTVTKENLEELRHLVEG